MTDRDQNKPLSSHARNLLRESEDRYKTVFENTGTGTFVKEQDMTISMVNSRFEELTGYSKNEIEGRMRWPDFIHPGDRARLIGYHTDRREAKQAPTETECRIVDRDGHTRQVYLKLDLIPGTGKSIGSLMDISRLKTAEHDLRENQALFSAIVESFEGNIYLVSKDFRLEYMNARAISRYGRDATGDICHKALYQRDTVCPFCVHDQVMRGENVRFEVRNPRDRRWYHSTNSPIRHVDGTLSMLAMVADIHKRKAAEAALKDSEEELRKENVLLRSNVGERQKFGNIVGSSASMQAVYEQILNAASTDANAIIYGEPGTGKELVAHAIHEISDRHKNRIVPVHCGAIPENLFESEFFGYRRGAFSGAEEDRDGYVHFADGGTLFLDEIGEISPHIQVKLLRVIEGGGYTRVGGNQVKKSNVRIIAATNRDMKGLIKEKRVREDFFYRIHILPIYLPPLRERKEDLPLLIDHFTMLYGGKRNLPPIAGKKLAKLAAYNWPGNVRELQNVIIRYCNQETIELMNKPFPGQSELDDRHPEQPAVPAVSLAARMEELEKEILMETLNMNQWHRSKAAEALSVDRKTLFNKMKKHGLSRK